MSVKIGYLKNHPEYVSLLAEWYLSAWGKYNPSNTIETCTQRIEGSLNTDNLPIGYIAFDQEKPVGMAALLEANGLESKLSPWLGSVCVEVSSRNRGIGKKIINFALEQAKQTGFPILYLWVYAEDTLAEWYQSMGWKLIGEDFTKAGHPVKIMSINL
jgi:GNAT superfamily N-acetyltransferase